MFAVGLRFVEINGKFPIAAGGAGANNVAIGVADGDGATRLGIPGDGLTIV